MPVSPVDSEANPETSTHRRRRRKRSRRFSPSGSFHSDRCVWVATCSEADTFRPGVRGRRGVVNAGIRSGRAGRACSTKGKCIDAGAPPCSRSGSRVRISRRRRGPNLSQDKQRQNDGDQRPAIAPKLQRVSSPRRADRAARGRAVYRGRRVCFHLQRRLSARPSFVRHHAQDRPRRLDGRVKPWSIRNKVATEVLRTPSMAVAPDDELRSNYLRRPGNI